MCWNRHNWVDPVQIYLPDGAEPELVRTGREALDLLLKRWPGPDSNAYRLAANICAKCVQGRVGCGLARELLIAAAVDAGLRVGE